MSLKHHKKMKTLPFSLIESEILPRLAARTDIGRCRCVCKQWNSSLSTPNFARMHLHNHGTINDYKLLLFDGFTFHTLPLNNYNPNPNPNPNHNPIFILASLHGLVCLGSKESSTQLVFWNPLTGAYKRLASGPRFNFSKNVARDAIGFYIGDSCDYKIVCVIGGGGLFGAHIYSHRLDSWKRIEFPFAFTEICVWSPATFCGQGLYFTLKHYTLSMEMEGKWWIICFDVKTETFKKILFPPIPDGVMDRCGSLVVLNGCVHLCVSYKITTYLKQGDLWRLDDDGDGWLKVAAFSDPQDKDLLVTRQHICTAGTGRNWLVVLDKENNSFKKMNMEDFTTHYQYFCSPSWEYVSSRIMYVETLVSPNP